MFELTKRDQELFLKIKNHIAKLYKEWQDDENKDGHHKMSEGSITLKFFFPNWFDVNGDKDMYIKSQPEVQVEVYSYIFGEGRLHTYASLEEAWAEIKDWKYN